MVERLHIVEPEFGDRAERTAFESGNDSPTDKACCTGYRHSQSARLPHEHSPLRYACRRSNLVLCLSADYLNYYTDRHLTIFVAGKSIFGIAGITAKEPHT
jgi:hypothetical protein